VDPAVLHIGNGAAGNTLSTYNTGCADGGCPLYTPGGSGNPSEVNGIKSVVDIYMNSGGAPAQNNPVLLILAVPNDTTKTQLNASSIASVQLYHSTSSSLTISNVSYTFGDANNTYHLTSGTSGYQGSFKANGFTDKNGVFHANSNEDVYNALNLTGNASNNFGNWAGADQQVDGINATSFGIYVFALKTGSFDKTDLLNIKFTNQVPLGTFVVAYGQTTGCSTAGCVYTTPFTESGLSVHKHLPEPASLFLMGLGIAAMVIYRRRLVPAKA